MSTTDSVSPNASGPELPPDSYLTLAGPGRAEIKIQRSRFLALAIPADSPADAKAIIADQARAYHDARHVCYAWRLGIPPEINEIRNDDGEPSGTAGEPILLEICKLGLTQVLVAVVRYFGGVKLGTGGLARAYAEAAAASLADAPRKTVRQGREFELRFAYNWQKSLQHLLANHDGEIRRESYGADICWRIWLPHSRWQQFASALTETTAGAVDLNPGTHP